MQQIVKMMRVINQHQFSRNPTRRRKQNCQGLKFQSQKRTKIKKQLKVIQVSKCRTCSRYIAMEKMIRVLKLQQFCRNLACKLQKKSQLQEENPLRKLRNQKDQLKVVKMSQIRFRTCYRCIKMEKMKKVLQLQQFCRNLTSKWKKKSQLQKENRLRKLLNQKDQLMEKMKRVMQLQ